MIIKRKTIQRILIFVLIFVVLFTAVSCGKTADPQETGSSSALPEEDRVIAFVYDSEKMAAGRADRGISAALSEYSSRIGAEFFEFSLSSMTDKSRLEALDSAVECGADVVVCSGDFMLDAVMSCQDEYRDTMFLVVGGYEPEAGLGEVLSENVHLILFSASDAGYVAGYIAVCEGAKAPGFASFSKNTLSAEYFGGFTEGVCDASEESGVEVQTVFCSTDARFEPVQVGDSVEKKDVSSRRLFENGCDVVAAIGAEVYPACAAASSFGGRVISVCQDASDDYKVVLPSPVFDYGAAAEYAVTRLFNEGKTWSVRDAGTVSVVGMAEGCISLSTENACEDTVFNKEMFESLKEAFKNGTVRPEVRNDFDSIENGGLTINYIN